MRFIPLVVVALVTNFLLFLLMHNMVAADGQRIVRDENFRGIDFIRMKRQVESPKSKSRTVPERPSLAKATPPPERMKRMVLTKPEVEQIQPPLRPIRSAMRLRGGPYLGQFVPDPLPVVEGPGDVGLSVAPNIGLGIIETDVIPMVRVPPRYPRRAIRSKIEGVVTVEFTITSEGSVIDPTVVQAVPPSVFNRAALQAIRRWKFRPKFIEGKPVQRRAMQNIRFSLQK
ncbi:MAG: energy transducer TonB [Nitrospira sp.]|nr:energy transducer TonB [Candidatus Manganitrophaceae bacterium]HIL35052.1 energy transducer TonB [Candidatus Manganitrophaceae bacterium]